MGKTQAYADSIFHRRDGGSCMNISAQDVINAIFHPDDTVCLRIFDDRKEGIFTGAKMSVEAGKFFAVESTLKEHNQKNHGIFLW